MSSSVAAIKTAYSTGETALYNNSCSTQPSNPPPLSLEIGPPQRRRVNPESLAARLGPELVSEMEKYIIPGSIEMPPFSVRRDIQIKFGIDRRHIYDFFHSRGLRCLNEKAMRNNCLELKSSRPARGITPLPSFPEPRKRRAAAAASDATPLKRIHAPRKQKGRQKRLERPPSPSGPNNTPYYDAPLLPEPSLCLSELEVDNSMADVTPELLPPADASFLTSDAICTPCLGQFSIFSPEINITSDLYPCCTVSSLLGLNPSTSMATLSTSPSTSSMSSDWEPADPKLPKSLPLSSQERKAHYAWLDEIIGPASGIQESIGTYKAFMEHQREVYYDRLSLMAEQPKKAAIPSTIDELMSCLEATQTSGISLTCSSGSSAVTAPQPQVNLGRLSAYCSSPGHKELPNPDICPYSQNQGYSGSFFSVPPPNVRLNSRLLCSIPDWTARHSRRRTFSATVDM